MNEANEKTPEANEGFPPVCCVSSRRDAHKLCNNIVLIGMPASGKSTIGRALAKALDMDFRDGDDIIREKTGKTLEEIIEERGPLGFIALEEEILSNVCVRKTVFSPGGSCAYEPYAMERLGRSATILYLRAPYEDIEARVGDLQKRGVVLKNGIGTSLQELYDERSPLYEGFADVIVDEGGLTISQATQKALAALKDFWKE